MNRAEVMRLRGTGRRRRRSPDGRRRVERIRPERCRLGVLRAGRAPVAHGRPRGRGGVISAGARPWRRPAARVGAPSPGERRRRGCPPRPGRALADGCETGSRAAACRRASRSPCGRRDRRGQGCVSGARGDRARLRHDVARGACGSSRRRCRARRGRGRGAAETSGARSACTRKSRRRTRQPPSGCSQRRRTDWRATRTQPSSSSAPPMPPSIDLAPCETFAELRRLSAGTSIAGGERAGRTFLYTDICDSTPLVEAIGGVDRKVGWHDRTLRQLFDEHGGEEVDHSGDGFFVAFPDAKTAVECAAAVRAAWRRTGARTASRPRCEWACTPPTSRSAAGYSGKGVHEAARVGALGEARRDLRQPHDGPARGRPRRLGAADGHAEGDLRPGRRRNDRLALKPYGHVGEGGHDDPRTTSRRTHAALLSRRSAGTPLALPRGRPRLILGHGDLEVRLVRRREPQGCASAATAAHR